MLRFRVVGPRKTPRIELRADDDVLFTVPGTALIDFSIELRQDTQEVWSMGARVPQTVKTGLQSALLRMTLFGPALDEDRALARCIDLLFQKYGQEMTRRAGARESDVVCLTVFGMYDDEAIAPVVGVAQNDAKPGETVRVQLASITPGTLAEVFARESTAYPWPASTRPPARAPKSPVTTFGGTRPPLADPNDL
jgi:hypothetical protein